VLSPEKKIERRGREGGREMERKKVEANLISRNFTDQKTKRECVHTLHRCDCFVKLCQLPKKVSPIIFFCLQGLVCF
jgi:hypothetical protein